MNMIQIGTELIKNPLVEVMTVNLRNYLNTIETNYDVLKAQFASCNYNRITEPVTYFEKSIADMQEHWKEYLWLEQILEDEQSKLVLKEMLLAKATMDTTHIENAFLPQMPYFSPEIWGELGNEVYADCGAYEGDSILKFISVCPWYKKIFAFEAIPEVMTRCQKMLDAFSDNSIEYVQKAVDKCEQTLLFDAGSMHGESCASEEGTIRVESIPLDTLFSEDISFIKMDIEGSELDAILGAQKIISSNTPKMAICVYHKVDDFWKIPQTICAINPNYTFMLRQHDYEVYSETVLYCIPKQQEKKITEKKSETVLHRLCAATQKLSVYSRQENENLLQHGYDKKWFLKQLMGLTSQIEAKNVYVQDLQDGKQWLEQQYTGLVQELETTKQWNTELQEAKQWLDQQNTGLVLELETVKHWNTELQEAKKWLDGQYETLTKENKEMRVKVSEYENTIARQKYMLNVLLRDPGVQKAIKKAKIPVSLDTLY